MNFLSLIGNIFTPAAKLIDDLHTSEEEKLLVKQKMFEIQVDAFNKAEEYESALLEAKTTIITAEAQSDSVIAKNWRPITMLAFVIAVMGHWFGLTPDTLAQADVDNMFLLVQIGLGGYVAGRSLEKTSSKVADILSNK
jgi:hypothetical protein